MNTVIKRSLGKLSKIDLREVWEETGIKVDKPKPVFEMIDHVHESRHVYYVCQWVSGEEPSLKGEEGLANSESNFYEPMWVPLSKIKTINLLPKYAKEWLEENIKIVS